MDWDCKERGDRLDERNGVKGLYLSCLACGRTVQMLWEDVVKTWGVGTYMRDIARSLKCSACGARRGSIMAWAETRPKHCTLPELTSYPVIPAIEWQRKLL